MIKNQELEQAGADDRAQLVADGLMRVSEAAAFLGLSRSSIYQLMERGELPWVKLGGARRIPRRAVVELAARRLRGGWSLPAGPGREGSAGGD